MSLKESQALDLLDVLRDHDVDRKISEFTSIKAQVKHQAVQSEAINPLFDACRLGIQSSNSSLSAHALSCLGHLIKRVTIQEPSRIRPQAHHVLPILVEKIGDQKDRNRSIALNATAEMYKNAPAEVEKYIKESGFGSRNPRTKQESVKWLAQMHTANPGFSFRSYTPFMMMALEDASEPVRETAKDVVVELFRDSPDHAKSDLKRELQKRQVRKGIAAYIVGQLGITGVDVELKSSVRPQPDAQEEVGSGRQGGKAAAASNAGRTHSSSYLSALPGHEMEDLQPAHVNTNRELEEIFQDMIESFDGRESEHNWLAREKNVKKLRHLARGNAYKDFQSTFQVGIKSLLDGILKTVNSLRTSLSTNGGQLVKDLAIVMGPGLDPMVEILLSNLVKLCAGTKKITSQLGQVVVAVVMANVSYHPKLLAHILIACNDKNVSPRSYAAGWIAVVLESHVDQKGYIEHTGGLDVIEKCIKRGLADANPGVRESMRQTYWKFVAIWPHRAEAIADSLEPSHRKLLDKSNPNPGAQASTASTARVPALARSVTAPARPSIKDAIKARKANLAKTQSHVDVAARPHSPTALAGPSGLASAPVRRPGMKARPQVHAEPVPQAEPRAGYVRAVSPGASSRATPMRTNGGRTSPQSPPHRPARGVTPGRTQTHPASSRKLTVLEQLNHTDWKIRVEGVVTVACILAKRTPPGYEGQKMPLLPPSDVFAPTLVKLLNDPQPEVVEHVVAPEVLAELAKVVGMDQIVPKVLLLSEGDDEHHAHATNAASMPAVKQLMTEEAAMDLAFKIITSLGGSGIVPRKLALGTFTMTQKRKIIHGCLLWMNEIIQSYARGSPNGFFTDGNYKSLVNRLITMHAGAKSANHPLIATILKSLQQIDMPEFEKILATLESQIVKDLKTAWGQSGEEDAEIVVEEQVAAVEQVLGSLPHIASMASPTNTRRIQSPPSTIEHLPEEDFTLINPLSELPPAPRPATPPKVPGQDDAQLHKLPQLPSTPEKFPDLLAQTGSAKPSRVEDQKPSITVYQDPVVHSNGAPVEKDNAVNDWNRHKLRKTSPTIPRTPEHSTRLLTSLIDKLQACDMDTQAFRKLIGIARENPVRGALQEQNGDGVYDIWQGGVVFAELLEALLGYLSSEVLGEDLALQGLLVLKQLINKAAPYFDRREEGVLSALIVIRGRYPAKTNITSAIEEISEIVVPIADPTAGIEALLKITASKQAELQTPGWCMTLSILAELVRTSRVSSLEAQLDPLGKLAVKALDSPDSEVRRACVALCIEMHNKVKDDERLFDEILTGMKSGHQNLLAYYFEKGKN